MGLQIVQTKEGPDVTDTSITTTLDAVPTNGNLLVLVIREADGASTFTLPTNWSWATGNPVVNSGATIQYGIAYRNVVDGDSASITVSSTALVSKRTFVWEISGQDKTSAVLDRTASNAPSGSSTGVNTGSTGTLSQPDEIAIAACGQNGDNGGGVNIDSGFTLDGSTSSRFEMAHKIVQGSTTALDPTFSWITSRTGRTGLIVTFREQYMRGDRMAVKRQSVQSSTTW